MFSYYVNLSIRSLSRNVVITGLMILLIAFGVASSITTYALLGAVSANPMPTKSHQLFIAQTDSRLPRPSTRSAGCV
jgi:putative ABC transport system permease protein